MARGAGGAAGEDGKWGQGRQVAVPQKADAEAWGREEGEEKQQPWNRRKRRRRGEAREGWGQGVGREAEKSQRSWEMVSQEHGLWPGDSIPLLSRRPQGEAARVS